uniref:Protein lifeguard 2 n=1 Tax=Scleropages formosus TaxID=113540 RepID=A0A8C9S561_SCLFO
MTQGKISLASKTPSGAQGGGAVPESPPSYEEATTGSSPCHSFDEGEVLTEFTWEDKNIRRMFIRKVYSILMIQLFVMVAIVALFTFCEPVKICIQANPGWYWASYAIFIATYLTLSCCTAPRRKFPWNLILLAIFVSIRKRSKRVFYNTKSVVICLGITALVCLSVTVFSFQTKIDFTSCQGVLFVLCTVLLYSGLFLIIVIPLGYVPWFHAIFAIVGAVLFTLFLALDTQLLMGNKRHTISPEEYIFATLNIYLDIIYMFSFFLQLFGSERN